MRKAILASMLLVVAVAAFGQHGKPQLGGKTASKSKAKPKPKQKPTPQDKPWYSPCGIYFKSLDDLIDTLKDEWSLVTETKDGEKFYFNSMKPQTCEGGVLGVWIRTAEAKSQGYSLDRYELKCAARKLRLASSTDYDKDGRVLHSTSFDSASWDDVIPDSVGEAILQTVCRRTW